MSFGEKLQALRRENGLTQEDFAAQMKVSRQAVSKWESSRGYPEIEKIIYICNRYGVTRGSSCSTGGRRTICDSYRGFPG